MHSNYASETLQIELTFRIWYYDLNEFLFVLYVFYFWGKIPMLTYFEIQLAIFHPLVEIFSNDMVES